MLKPFTKNDTASLPIGEKHRGQPFLPKSLCHNFVQPGDDFDNFSLKLSRRMDTASEDPILLSDGIQHSNSNLFASKPPFHPNVLNLCSEP
jgi:hypothetical protein